MRERASPLEDRIEEDDRGTYDDGSCCQHHGTEADRPRIDDCIGKWHPLLDPELDEVNQDDGIPDNDSCACDKTDHGSRR